MNSLQRFLVSTALGSAAVSTVARAEWRQSENSLAWVTGPTPVWQFNFDPAKGKTFFHPLAVEGGSPLTLLQPEDHPWHYGLWFSWKFINGVNYWEEDRATGKAEGQTRWSKPRIVTAADGRATIHYEVSYAHPSGRVDLTEVRELTVSPVNPYGGYTIDWRSRFTAGDAGAVLGRTPMPGEPDGQVNGGYGGLGLRLAGAPTRVRHVTTDEVVTRFESDRARPAAPGLACVVSDVGGTLGSIVILSDPANIGERAPWYIANGDMRFICAAVLAPKVRTLPAGSQWTLRYRILVGGWGWTPDRLRGTYAGWRENR